MQQIVAKQPLEGDGDYYCFVQMMKKTWFYLFWLIFNVGLPEWRAEVLISERRGEILFCRRPMEVRLVCVNFSTKPNNFAQRDSPHVTSSTFGYTRVVDLSLFLSFSRFLSTNTKQTTPTNKTGKMGTTTTRALENKQGKSETSAVCPSTTFSLAHRSLILGNRTNCERVRSSP